MSLYDHIGVARKFDKQQAPIQESVTSAEPDKTRLALDMAKRLSETKKVEPEGVSLKAVPISN